MTAPMDGVLLSPGPPVAAASRYRAILTAPAQRHSTPPPQPRIANPNYTAAWNQLTDGDQAEDTRRYPQDYYGKTLPLPEYASIRTDHLPPAYAYQYMDEDMKEKLMPRRKYTNNSGVNGGNAPVRSGASRQAPIELTADAREEKRTRRETERTQDELRMVMFEENGNISEGEKETVKAMCWSANSWVR